MNSKEHQASSEEPGVEEKPRHVVTPASSSTHLLGRHQTPGEKGEPSVCDLGETAAPGFPATAAGTQANIWHPSEARLEARGQREEDGFLLEHSSVPGCCSAEDRSGCQYPCYLPGYQYPEVQGLLKYEVLSCTYTLRSKGQSEGSSREKMQPRAVEATFNFLSHLKLGSHLLPPHP